MTPASSPLTPSSLGPWSDGQFEEETEDDEAPFQPKVTARDELALLMAYRRQTHGKESRGSKQASGQVLRLKSLQKKSRRDGLRPTARAKVYSLLSDGEVMHQVTSTGRHRREPARQGRRRVTFALDEKSLGEDMREEKRDLSEEGSAFNFGDIASQLATICNGQDLDHQTP